MSESQLSKGIRDALAAKGCWVLRLNSGSMVIGTGKARRFIKLGEPGTPDLLVLSPVMLFLEVKLPKGRLEKSQLAWHEKARERCVPVAVVRSIGEALEAVTQLGRPETAAEFETRMGWNQEAGQ